MLGELGATDAHGRAGALEIMGKQNDWDHIPGQFDLFCRELEEVKTGLERFVKD